MKSYFPHHNFTIVLYNRYINMLSSLQIHYQPVNMVTESLVNIDYTNPRYLTYVLNTDIF